VNPYRTLIIFKSLRHPPRPFLGLAGLPVAEYNPQLHPVAAWRFAAAARVAGKPLVAAEAVRGFLVPVETAAEGVAAADPAQTVDRIGADSVPVADPEPVVPPEFVEGGTVAAGVPPSEGFERPAVQKKVGTAVPTTAAQAAVESVAAAGTLFGHLAGPIDGADPGFWGPLAC